jgi:hypothetical protein
LEAERADGFVVAVENTAESEGFGDFLEEFLGIAIQVEIAKERLGLQFGGRQRLAGGSAVLESGCRNGRTGRSVLNRGGADSSKARKRTYWLRSRYVRFPGSSAAACEYNRYAWDRWPAFSASRPFS